MVKESTIDEERARKAESTTPGERAYHISPAMRTESTIKGKRACQPSILRVPFVRSVSAIESESAKRSERQPDEQRVLSKTSDPTHLTKEDDMAATTKTYQVELSDDDMDKLAELADDKLSEVASEVEDEEEETDDDTKDEMEAWERITKALSEAAPIVKP